MHVHATLYVTGYVTTVATYQPVCLPSYALGLDRGTRLAMDHGKPTSMLKGLAAGNDNLMSDQSS